MVHKPKVSICIPTFNGANFIINALDSVLQQKFRDFEVVIVDNCSMDKTEALVIELSPQFENIRFFRNAKNIGLAGSFNKCLELARGEYIKYLCVDDLLMPDCLSQMVAGLEAYPAASLVCGGRLSIDESGRVFGLRRYSSHQEVIPGFTAISRCLFGGNFIGEPTAVMFRKSDALSRFRDDLPQLMDMEMWFNILEHGALLSIETPVCAIRFHDNQMTLENIRSSKLVDDNIRVFNEFSEKSYLQVTSTSKVRHRLLMTYRIWRSRKFMSKETKRYALKKYGLFFMYFLMPAMYFTIALKRCLFARKA